MISTYTSLIADTYLKISANLNYIQIKDKATCIPDNISSTRRPLKMYKIILEAHAVWFWTEKTRVHLKWAKYTRQKKQGSKINRRARNLYYRRWLVLSLTMTLSFGIMSEDDLLCLVRIFFLIKRAINSEETAPHRLFAVLHHRQQTSVSQTSLTSYICFPIKFLRKISRTEKTVHIWKLFNFLWILKVGLIIGSKQYRK